MTNQKSDAIERINDELAPIIDDKLTEATNGEHFYVLVVCAKGTDNSLQLVGNLPPPQMRMILERAADNIEEKMPSEYSMKV